MDVAVVPVFGAHRIGVIRGGEIAPRTDEVGIVGSEDLVTEGVEVVHGGILHGVRGPSREVALGIGPGNGLWHGNLAGGLHEAASFEDGDKFIFVLAEPSGDEMIHKFENASVGPLVLAESLEIHKEID